METHHHHHRHLQHHSWKFVGQHLPPSSWRPLVLAPPSLVSCSSSRWDSNAETFRPRNFTDNRRQQQQQQQQQQQNKRRWWSDEDTQFQDDEEVEQTTTGIFEEAIHSVWFLQIFKSYGWTLPVILGSWLLSSGPKAFLMALILPLGQSALALAFEKLWGPSERKPKRKYRMRRKPRVRNNARVEEEPEENQKTRKGYQSWVVEDNGSVDTGSRKAAPSFGGWDDLERSRPATKSSRGGVDGSQRISMEAGRLSRRERKSDTPLLLRLLIAIFPFLGSWTKML